LVKDGGRLGATCCRTGGVEADGFCGGRPSWTPGVVRMELIILEIGGRSCGGRLSWKPGMELIRLEIGGRSWWPVFG
jgi:hypothetical protein